MQLLHINTARAQPLLTANGLVPSGIVKRARSGPVGLADLGLDGDEQADTRVHGGPNKAVYAYPSEHYAFWNTVRGQARVAGAEAGLPPGSMGENLTLAGLQEGQVWQGDVLRFAGCELVVSEPRYPCFKFNAAMGFSQAVKLMAQSGYCGFYLAVKRPGTLAAGEAFELLPGPRELRISDWFRSVMSKQRG